MLTKSKIKIIIVNGKPEHCIHCHLPELKEVIYGEPSERVDKDRFILGGCCISEYSHNWECPQCKAMYRDESWW